LQGKDKAEDASVPASGGLRDATMNASTTVAAYASAKAPVAEVAPVVPVPVALPAVSATAGVGDDGAA